MKTLVDVANQVNVRLTATLTTLGLPIPTYHYGKSFLFEQEDAPRIVWVPRSGGADGKIMHAADFPPDFAVPKVSTDFPTPGPLWHRTPTLEAHVWGLRANPESDLDITKDFAAAEILANHLVAAFHTEMFGSYQMAGENWDAPQANQAAATRRGAVVVVSFQVGMAWVRETDATAVVTLMPITVGSAHA